MNKLNKTHEQKSCIEYVDKTLEEYGLPLYSTLLNTVEVASQRILQDNRHTVAKHINEAPVRKNGETFTEWANRFLKFHGVSI